MGAPTTRAHYAFRSEQLPCDSLVIDCDMAVVWSVNDVTSKRSSSACTVGASSCNATGLNTFEWSTDLCSWFLLPMRCCASRLLAVALTLSVSMSVCLSLAKCWQSFTGHAGFHTDTNYSRELCVCVMILACLFTLARTEISAEIICAKVRWSLLCFWTLAQIAL